MNRWLTLLAGLTFLVFLPADEAEAQVTLGPQLGLWDVEHLAVGARVDIGLGERLGLEEDPFNNLFLSIDGNYLFDTDDVLVFDVNAAVPFEVEAAVTPFAGAGLNFWSGNDTRSGLNLLGGIFFDLGTVPSFAQLQYWTASDGGLTLSAGVLFGG